jgi:dTDP-4-dehydrorhamnose reductase
MAQVLVTGATGLLGHALVPALAALGHAVLRHGHQAAADRPCDLHADLTRAEATEAMLSIARPEVIVNLAALTDVDACELEPERAHRLNVRSVQNLAAWVQRQAGGCHLLHLSTDQVYDAEGDRAGPFGEDQVTIRNHYAASKLAAELAASVVPATVLRSNFFGRSRCPRRASLTDWLWQSLSAGRAIQVFDDVLFSPLSIDTLCGLVACCLAQRPVGVFNLGSHDGMSKADFAFAFAAAAGLPSSAMQRGRSSEMTRLKARRPADMRMDPRRIEQTLGRRLPRLIDEINFTGAQYREPL